MQKFILLTLVLGLAFFLYLIQTEQINTGNFTATKFKGDTNFEIRKQESDDYVKTSDIYVIIKDREYKIFTFSGEDFKKLSKTDYAKAIYKVPPQALHAVTGTWIGNRYVFYILEKENKTEKTKLYEIYKTEYPTDDIELLKYSLIKSVEYSEFDTKTEITY